MKQVVDYVVSSYGYSERRACQVTRQDFVHDQLSNGQKFRMLTVVDVFSREALAIEIGRRLRGGHVVKVLNRLVRQRGAPRYLFADNVLCREAARGIGHQVSLHRE